MLEILVKTVLIGWMAVAIVMPGCAERAAAGIEEWRIDGFDGFDGLAVPSTLGEDTVYAPGYSAEAFEQIESGMTRAQVHALLGPPLRTTANDSESITEWQLRDCWTYRPGSTHYRFRSIVYSDNRVTQKRGYLYFD
jgi:hypothetical protein